MIQPISGLGGGMGGVQGPQPWQKEGMQAIMNQMNATVNAKGSGDPDKQVGILSQDCFALQQQMRQAGCPQTAIDAVGDYAGKAISYIRDSGNPPPNIADVQNAMEAAEAGIWNS